MVEEWRSGRIEKWRRAKEWKREDEKREEYPFLFKLLEDEKEVEGRIGGGGGSGERVE